MFSPALCTFTQSKKGSSDWCSKSCVRAMCRVQCSASRSGHVAAASGLRPCAVRRALVSVRTFRSQAFERGLTFAALAEWSPADGAEAARGETDAEAAAAGRAKARETRTEGSGGECMGTYPAESAG